MLNRTIVTLTLAASALVGCAGEVTTDETTGQEQQALTGDKTLVVVLNGGARGADVAADAGAELLYDLSKVGVAVVHASDAARVARSLKRDGRVHSFAEHRSHKLPQVAAEMSADEPTSADFFYNAGMMWGINRVNAPAAWQTTSGSHDTTVAVLDTGVAYTHPDLAPNMVFAGCYTTASLAGTGSCSPYPDYHWHGTHVAGTVAAAFGGGPAVGVGPNLGIASYNVFELVVRDGEAGVEAFDLPLWVAIIDAADRGYDVINMSLGGYLVFPAGPDNAANWRAWNRVINYAQSAGTTVVAAAGNDAFDMNGPVAHIPAELPGVISVGATGVQPAPRYPYPGSFDVPAFYSNYGAALTVSAPGGDCGETDDCSGSAPNWFEHLILSTYVEANPVCAATASCPLGYVFAAGTSMASPHVAGVAGLMMDNDPGLAPNQVAAILKRTAQNVGSRQDYGHGIVDAAAALAQ